MKKLNLKALELGATEALTRSQLKNVLGGVLTTTTQNCATAGACWTCCANQGHDKTYCDSFCG